MSLFTDFIDRAQEAMDAVSGAVEEVYAPTVKLLHPDPSLHPVVQAAVLLKNHGLLVERPFRGMADADADGVPDVVELIAGTNPYDPANRPGKFEPRTAPFGGVRVVSGRLPGAAVFPVPSSSAPGGGLD